MAKRIKVLHVAPLPPPLGGMVSYIQGLLNSDVFKTVDYRVVRFSFFDKEKLGGVPRFFANCFNSVILTFNFLFQTITWQPEIVHIQSNSGLGFFEKSWIAVLAKLLGKKTIFHCHGGYLRDWYRKSPRLVQKLIKWCASVNDRIMTGSPQMRETWLLIGIPDEKIKYIGNAVNLPDLAQKKAASRTSILFLTRVVIEKGIIELINAFFDLKRTNPDLELRLVGADTKDTSYVKSFLEKNDPDHSIEYIGPVSDERKHAEYLRADIFAFPTYVEDQSYAVMEAMSYGLAVVASNVGGVPSLVKHGVNGLLIQPRDVASLRDGLERVIRDSDLRQRLGKSARQTIEMGFTWNVRSQEIVMLYQQVLNA